MKAIILSTTFLLALSSYGQERLIGGKIIGEKLDPLNGVVVTNRGTNEKARSSENGFYQIKANKGDTITYDYVGTTSEIRVVDNFYSKLNMILVDKSVNCLGATWTRRQYKRAAKLINKKYVDLYKQATKKGIWQNG